MSQAELYLLSAVLRQKDHITPSAHGIVPAMFHTYTEEWEWLEDFIRRYRKTPSKAAFKKKFPRTRLKAVDDVEHFIDEVKNSHVQHELMRFMDEGADMLSAGEAQQALRMLNRSLGQLHVEVGGAAKDTDIIRDYRDTLEEVQSRVERVNDTGMAGIATGFATLDERTGGPAPGDFWVLAARLGQGKTWTLIRFAAAAVFAGHTVQYHSLEQTRTQIAMRFHSFASSKHGREVFKNLDLMRGQNFDLRQYRKFLDSLGKKVEGRLHVSDTSRGRVNINAIAAGIERNKPSVVFIDYLTLLEQHGDDWRATAKLSGDLKLLAQRYNIPIVTAAQVNRLGQGKEPPEAHHLSASDSIGQDADALVTMKQMSTHVMKLRMAKFRNGQDGFSWYARFSPGTGEYEEIAYDEALDLIDEDAAEEDE